MKKNYTRREAIALGLKAGAMVPLAGPLISCSPSTRAEKQAGKDISPLKILILGGTSFLGPHQVSYALSRGHQVSIFTRGKTRPTIHQALFDQVEQLTGDREDNLTALEQGSWDVVIDNSGRKVTWTEATARLLKDRVQTYLYTSSTGVYYPYLTDGITEAQKLVTQMPSGINEEEELEYGYGVMKTNSETAARSVFGEDRTLVVRPTYMIGPADKTNRFIHWPLRLSRSGEILIPGRPDDPVQYMDVRDVAEFMIRMAEQKASGTYNVAGPGAPQTIMQFATEAIESFEVESTLISVNDYDFLKAHGIHYLVPWIPVEGNNYGSARVVSTKAMEAGLQFRDLKTTIRDTYDWWNTLPQETRDAYEQDDKNLINREAEILKKWKER